MFTAISVFTVHGGWVNKDLRDGVSVSSNVEAWPWPSREITFWQSSCHTSVAQASETLWVFSRTICHFEEEQQTPTTPITTVKWEKKKSIKLNQFSQTRVKMNPWPSQDWIWKKIVYIHHHIFYNSHHSSNNSWPQGGLRAQNLTGSGHQRKKKFFI